jgi:hypothetical protein
MLAWVQRNEPSLRRAADAPVLGVTFARTRATFAAAVLLTRDGYGPQAAMLARSIFEDLVLSFWMTWCARPQWVEARLQAQRRHRQMLEEPRPEDAALNDERELYDALFGVYGQASWWSRSVTEVDGARPGERRWRVSERRQLDTLLDLLQATAERVGPSATRDQQEYLGGVVRRLRYLYARVNRVNNDFLHHSVAGISAVDERVANEATLMVRSALFMTFDPLLSLLVVRDQALATDYLAHRPGFDPLLAESGGDDAPPQTI